MPFRSSSLKITSWVRFSAGEAGAAKREVVEDWARFTRDKARAFAPKRTRKLANSIQYEIRNTAKGSTVGQVYSTMPIRARWAQYGTGIRTEDPEHKIAKKLIRPLRARALRWPMSFWQGSRWSRGSPRRGRIVVRTRRLLGGKLAEPLANNAVRYNYRYGVRGQRPTYFFSRAASAGAAHWQFSRDRLTKSLRKIVQKESV